jgi:hypothetical protein
MFMSTDTEARTPGGGDSAGEPFRAASVEDTFRELADEWYLETGGSSLIRQKIAHPAYCKIIDLGKPAVPLLLRELQLEPDYWFWALHRITGENPVRTGASFDETVEDWLAWGRARGFVD